MQEVTIDQQFIEFIAKNLVDNEADVRVERLVDERGVLLTPVSYTHLRAHETVLDLVCRLLLEKKKNTTKKKKKIYSE